MTEEVPYCSAQYDGELKGERERDVCKKPSGCSKGGALSERKDDDVGDWGVFQKALLTL